MAPNLVLQGIIGAVMMALGWCIVADQQKHYKHAKSMGTMARGLLVMPIIGIVVGTILGLLGLALLSTATVAFLNSL